MAHLQLSYLLMMVIFHSYVSLPEGTPCYDYSKGEINENHGQPRCFGPRVAYFQFGTRR